MSARLFCLAVASLLGLVSPARAQTVGQLVDAPHACAGTPGGILGLTRQLARVHACMFPGELVELAAGSGMRISGTALPYASPQARDALYGARARVSFDVNSAFRTVFEQYWLQTSGRCGAVATPGSSNHESGAAVDIQQYNAVRPHLACRWPNIPNDAVHFDCPPYNAPKRTVLVFQRLWNANNPGDRIAEDGSWGPITRDRLRRTPTAGFRIDGCGAPACSGASTEDVCGVQLLQQQSSAYAPPRSTDVNGDGLADMCARGGVGVRCWPSTGIGWDEEWAPIPLSDAAGWNDVSNYATIRMGDVNGDGLADVCARSNSAFHCALSNGTGFEPLAVWRDGLSDAAGWNEPRFYTTIRLADVNGDGKDDLCARSSGGFNCWLSNGTAFDQHIEGPAWSDASGWGVPQHYGTIRMGDVNGDGLVDVCARAGVGMRCHLSSGDGFPTLVEGPAWGGGGWSRLNQWSTVRMLDYDGDGLDDLCARDSEGLRCARSTGASFEPEVLVAGLSDAAAWGDTSNFATLRGADIDGDGADELCARSDSRLHCWDWDGSAFVAIEGPAWSDASGFSAPQFYETLRFADVDGDGFHDACIRTSTDWRCHPSTGTGFADPVTLAELTSASGWSGQQYWSTILSAGPACHAQAEICNGRDDDCDGEVDEEQVCAPADGGMPNGRDAAAPGLDGGAGADGGEGTAIVGGCGCRATGARGGGLGIALFLALALVIGCRARRRASHR